MRIFYGQTDRKGVDGSATSALTVSKCENVDLFLDALVSLDFKLSVIRCASIS